MSSGGVCESFREFGLPFSFFVLWNLQSEKGGVTCSELKEVISLVLFTAYGLRTASTERKRVFRILMTHFRKPESD